VALTIGGAGLVRARRRRFPDDRLTAKFMAATALREKHYVKKEKVVGFKTGDFVSLHDPRRGKILGIESRHLAVISCRCISSISTRIADVCACLCESQDIPAATAVEPQ